MAFDLLTSTGLFFTYTVRTPDPSSAQIVEFLIESTVTSSAPVLVVNVATLAHLGRTVESILVDHVEHYERLTAADTEE